MNEALREALQYLVDELKRYASKNGLVPARLMHALCKAEAALASQPEQALSLTDVHKAIRETQQPWHAEKPAYYAVTDVPRLVAALNKTLATPVPTEEAGTPFDPREWIMSEMATEQIPEMWVQQLVARAYAAGQAAKGGREA